MSEERKQIPKWLLVSVLFFILVFTTLAFIRHYTFHSGWDLGINEQMISNSINGMFFHSDELQMNYLGNHFNLVLILILPIYYIFQDTLILFLIQSASIALGVIPLYFLSRKLLDERLSAIISILYLIQPFFWHVILLDFHVIVFSVPILIYMFFYIENKEWSKYYIFLFLLLMIKEDLSLVGIFFGFYLLLRKHYKEGLTTLVASMLWFIVVISLIMPFLNTGSIFGKGYVFYNIRYEYLGTNIGEIIKTIILNPVFAITYTGINAKISYLFIFFRSFLFIPLIGLPIITGIPIIIQNLFSNDLYQTCVTSHHNAQLIPIAFVALIYGIKNLYSRFNKSFVKRAVVVLLIVNVLLTAVYGVMPFIILNEKSNNLLTNDIKCFKNEFKISGNNIIDSSQENYLFLKNKIAELDTSKSIIATPTIFPHLMDHREKKSTRLHKDCFENDLLLFDFSDVEGPFSKEIDDPVKKLADMGYSVNWKKDKVHLFEKEKESRKC